MNKVIAVYKPIGKTPLEMIELLRKNNAELLSVKMAYAGRLDPMAEGLLLILLEKECKKRKEYENLIKVYEFEVLFGLSTDSYDLMGMLIDITHAINKKMIREQLRILTEHFIGDHNQLYPPFSSARVNGRALFYWAREKRLSEIVIPSKKIHIDNLKIISTGSLSTMEILKIQSKRVRIVKGKFRQAEILSDWQERLEGKRISFPTFKFQITCSSGTYVRSIADEMGKKIAIPSLALSIKRLKVGEFHSKHAQSLL